MFRSVFFNTKIRYFTKILKYEKSLEVITSRNPLFYLFIIIIILYIIKNYQNNFFSLYQTLCTYF